MAVTFYKSELNALNKSNRFRTRKLFDNTCDLASNDYLGLTTNKKLLKKAYKQLQNIKSHSSKASLLVNGYSKIHQKFEKALCKANKFQDGIIVGSGFLANISLIESLVRKKDILFIDQDYHASGILASKLAYGKIVFFKHNDYKDLETKIKQHEANRKIIAIEGVYSMSGEIAPKQFAQIANKHNALLIVDEAHSSGVIGDNLLGWFDYHHILPQPNHIKMGTLSKAYGSYGAYILGSQHIISYLQNRAKPIIYSTALSLFDTALGYENFKYILKNKKIIKKKILKYQNLIYQKLGIETKSLILPVLIGDNQKALNLQNTLLIKGLLVGAIRQPTVPKAILRIILKLDIKQKKILKLCRILKSSLG